VAIKSVFLNIRTWRIRRLAAAEEHGTVLVVFTVVDDEEDEPEFEMEWSREHEELYEYRDTNKMQSIGQYDNDHWVAGTLLASLTSRWLRNLVQPGFSRHMKSDCI
jgi:hypothetical protein